MQAPLILVIDDSRTIRALVECHLGQAGYRVAAASEAEDGLRQAQELLPDLILLDHQLPGTTGAEVCRRLLASEATAPIPVVVSSALRNRAYAQYTDFPNVVDQIPKPFTPEMLKTGVANALQLGAMVVRAQATGGAVPEAIAEIHDAALEGTTEEFPIRTVIDFLNNAQQSGRLHIEAGRDRIRVTLGGGRIQAVVSPTFAPERLEAYLPAELSDLFPLLPLTLGEKADPSLSGLLRLLERGLNDPRRVRFLLRCQSAVLIEYALRGEPGRFAFEPKAPPPPMFQALPLQSSLPALAVLGSRLSGRPEDLSSWAKGIFARQNPRGGNLDRAGLNPAELKILASLDGAQDVAAIAERLELEVAEVAVVTRGFERVGLAERRESGPVAAILVLDDDAESAHMLQRVLGSEGAGYRLQLVRDRIAARLLLRRQRFDLVIVATDRQDGEAFLRTVRESNPETTRIVALQAIEDEVQVAHLDSLGFDGVLSRPVTEEDVRATVRHLLAATVSAAGPAGEP